MFRNNNGSMVAAVALTMAMSVGAAMAQNSQDDSKLQLEVSRSLNKYKDVQASVQNGAVSLSGTVQFFGDKAEAERKVHKTKGVTGVTNEIQVVGPVVSDEVLQAKLVGKISTDRIGYGTIAFNAVSVSVQDGVVTLGGSTYGPVDKDYAISDASYMPGVKGVVDNIKVDPVSQFDDRIRIATARAIYGYPTLNKYAIDPARSIRIAVQNGNVTLVGVVLNKTDKEVAGLRANMVPGVFKVTNDLQVANQQSERN